MGKLGQKNSVLKRKNKNYVQKKLKIPISRVDLIDCSLYIKDSDNVNAYISLQTSLKIISKKEERNEKEVTFFGRLRSYVTRWLWWQH